MTNNGVIYQLPAAEGGWRWRFWASFVANLVLVTYAALVNPFFGVAVPRWAGGGPVVVHKQEPGQEAHADPELVVEEQPINLPPHNLPNEIDGVLVSDLNKSRIAGRWIKHDNGSYGWVSYSVQITIPSDAGDLVNASDSLWVQKN